MDVSDRRILLVTNPISGTLNKGALIERAERELTEAGFVVETRLTHGPGHGRELAAAAAAAGYHGVVAAGGDGTVNEVGSALCGTQTALGILPLGSGNGLARHLEESVDIDHALKVLCADHIKQCDYGTVNDMPFFCTFGLGFDAAVTERFASTRSRGIAAYIRSAVREYASYRPKEYEITTSMGTTQVRAFLVTIANASQFGNNAYVAPGASIKDGMLDLTIMYSANPLVHAISGARLFSGRLGKDVFINTFKTDHVIIKREPGPAHMDGELVDLPDTVDVKCHHGAINIFTDPEHTPFQPIVTPIRSLRNDINFHLRYLIQKGKGHTNTQTNSQHNIDRK